MTKPTLAQYEAAFDAYLYATADWATPLKGTQWEGDPRLAAYAAAEEGVADLLHEMHMAAEESGEKCKDCRHSEAERAARDACQKCPREAVARRNHCDGTCRLSLHRREPIE